MRAPRATPPCAASYLSDGFEVVHVLCGCIAEACEHAQAGAFRALRGADNFQRYVLVLIWFKTIPFPLWVSGCHRY